MTSPAGLFRANECIANAINAKKKPEKLTAINQAINHLREARMALEEEG
jgi:hypothetical protein